jgi:hypothetical protein
MLELQPVLRRARTMKEVMNRIDTGRFYRLSEKLSKLFEWNYRLNLSSRASQFYGTLEPKTNSARICQIYLAGME